MRVLKRTPFNIKLGLFLLAMALIVVFFGINRMMINQLRTEVKDQVEYLAKVYSNAINSSNEEDIGYVMEILLPSINFPIIITTKDEISAVLNLDLQINKNSHYGKK